MTTQWSKRKQQIKEEYLVSMVHEQEHQNRIKKQLEKVNEDGSLIHTVTSGDEGSEETGGNEAPHFDSLINLNAIAEKAKEAKHKKEEVLQSKKEDRHMRPVPFEIEGCQAGMKEDLNVVL